MNTKTRILNILKNLVHPAGIIGLVLAIAIPVLVYLGPNIGHKNTLKNLDLNLPLPLFAIQLIAGIALLVILRKDLREWLKGILPEKSIGIMMIIFTVAISVFAVTQIEARHRVQSDESIFLSLAQNMYYNQQSGTCNQGRFEDGGLKCLATSNSFKTKGLAFLYLLGMPLFGTDLHWVFNMEFLLLPLSILLMFLAVVAWTRQPLLAFFAALLMGLQPTVLFQFRSMSVEPLYIFLSALSLLVFKWAYDRNTIKHWTLLALVLAFFAQTRQETVFCLLPFILFGMPKYLDKKDAKAPTFFVALSLFSVPVLVTISYFQGFGFQGGEFEAHGHFWEDVVKNWEIMTKPLNDKGELSNPFLTYFNYLFAAGGIYLIFRAIWDAIKVTGERRFFYLKILVFLVLYHIQTYVILENVSGDFSIEINQRYSLVMLPSMAFLGALPVSHLIQALAKSMVDNQNDQKGVHKTLLIAALIAACGFTLWTGHYKEDFNKNIMYNRNHLTTEERELLNWLKDQPKKDRFFIYGRPWHFVGYGISSIHYDKARQMKTEALQSIIDKYNGEVYYVRGLDCWDSQTYHKKAVEHRIATTCDIFEREMELDGVKNILITNNYWLQIAKFNGRKNFNPTNIINVKSIKADSTAQDSISINYVLGEKNAEASKWNLRIILDNKVVMQEPYEFGKKTVSIPASSLQPGYNNIRFYVDNPTSGKKIADVTKSFFNKGEGVTNLTDLNPISHKQDWGSMKRNSSIEGNKLTVNGIKYDNGYGMHASSETVFNIEKKYRSFRTSFGLDDESLCSEGVRVELWGDGQLLNASQPFKSGRLQTITVPVEGVETLTLKSFAVGSIDCSHVDFIQPVLIP